MDDQFFAIGCFDGHLGVSAGVNIPGEKDEVIDLLPGQKVDQLVAVVFELGTVPLLLGILRLHHKRAAGHNELRLLTVSGQPGEEGVPLFWTEHPTLTVVPVQAGVHSEELMFTVRETVVVGLLAVGLRAVAALKLLESLKGILGHLFILFPLCPPVTTSPEQKPLKSGQLTVSSESVHHLVVGRDHVVGPARQHLVYTFVAPGSLVGVSEISQGVAQGSLVRVDLVPRVDHQVGLAHDLRSSFVGLVVVPQGTPAVKVATVEHQGERFALTRLRKGFKVSLLATHAFLLRSLWTRAVGDVQLVVRFRLEAFQVHYSGVAILGRQLQNPLLLLAVGSAAGEEHHGVLSITSPPNSGALFTDMPHDQAGSGR